MELLLTLLLTLIWGFALSFYFLYKHSIYFRHAQLVEEAYKKYGTF